MLSGSVRVWMMANGVISVLIGNDKPIKYSPTVISHRRKIRRALSYRRHTLWQDLSRSVSFCRSIPNILFRRSFRTFCSVPQMTPPVGTRLTLSGINAQLRVFLVSTPSLEVYILFKFQHTLFHARSRLLLSFFPAHSSSSGSSVPSEVSVPATLVVSYAPDRVSTSFVMVAINDSANLSTASLRTLFSLQAAVSMLSP